MMNKTINNMIMESPCLYKYLDVEGGLAMLENHNLQFTNATRLNDPFDCHPALYDYSIDTSISIEEEGEIIWLPSDFLSEKGAIDMKNMRDQTWICSLSNVYDSLLMWAYYGNHKGVCIGINMEKLSPNISKLMCVTRIGAMVLEVNYEEIIKKPNYFNDNKGYWEYQVATKAKEWEHEQEVRLALLNPSRGFIPSSIPSEYKKCKTIDYRDLRFYPSICGECFESLYLGINIGKKEKEEIIKTACSLNPDIKIYQMTTDPEAFRLKAEFVQINSIETNTNPIIKFLKRLFRGIFKKM